MYNLLDIIGEAEKCGGMTEKPLTAAVTEEILKGCRNLPVISGRTMPQKA